MPGFRCDYAVKRHGGAKRRRLPQRSEDEKSITASAVITPTLQSLDNPALSREEASVRHRSGHDKAKPQSGRISALAGRQGRLRACTQYFQRYHPQQRRSLVTTSIIKSDVIPGLWPGAAALFSGGFWLRCCRCARSAALIFVCCNYTRATAPAATRRDQPLMFTEPART